MRSMSDLPIRVTLVHGTAASDAAWIRPDSPMWEGLQAAGFVCDTFVWSGHNSHGARERAAHELAVHLGERAEPGVRQAVVAHSHGGNVAAHAVWRLLPDVGPIPVVTLATPFLFAQRRRVEPAVIAASVIAVLVVTLLAPFAAWAVVAESGGWSASRVLLLLVCLLLVPPALVQVVSLLVWRRAHGDPRSEDDRQAFVTHVQVPSCDDALLVVRAADDEAGVGLASVQLASLITSRLLAIARPAAWEGLVAGLFVVAAAVGLVSGGAWGDAAVLAVAVAVSGGVLAAYAFVAVPTLLGLLHGLDGPTTWFFANVTAEPTPPGRHRVVQRELRPLAEKPVTGVARLIPWAPLAHSSLYDNPEVVGDVVTHLLRGSRAD
jgi:hypothetical protein